MWVKLNGTLVNLARMYRIEKSNRRTIQFFSLKGAGSSDVSFPSSEERDKEFERIEKLLLPGSMNDTNSYGMKEN